MDNGTLHFSSTGPQVLTNRRGGTGRSSVRFSSNVDLSGPQIGACSGSIVIKGGSPVDTFIGSSGNDTVRGLGGNDLTNGDRGIDAANYLSARANYTITRNAGGTITVTDTRGGSPDGSATLTGMEWAQFTAIRVRIAGQKKQDLNDDATSDILWRNANGLPLSSDVNRNAGSQFANHGVVDNTWAIVR